MKPISVLMPPKVLAKRARKKTRLKNLTVAQADSAAQEQRINVQRQFLHDIANQLTIVALASFDLRNNESQSWNDHQLQALSALETAIQEAGELIGNLSKTFASGARSPVTVNRKVPPNGKPLENNVYPISPYLER